MSTPTVRHVEGRNCSGPTARSNFLSPSRRPLSVSRTAAYRPPSRRGPMTAGRGPVVGVQPVADEVAGLDLADRGEQRHVDVAGRGRRRHGAGVRREHRRGQAVEGLPGGHARGREGGVDGPGRIGRGGHDDRLGHRGGGGAGDRLRHLLAGVAGGRRGAHRGARRELPSTARTASPGTPSATANLLRLMSPGTPASSQSSRRRGRAPPTVISLSHGDKPRHRDGQIGRNHPPGV